MVPKATFSSEASLGHAQKLFLVYWGSVFLEYAEQEHLVADNNNSFRSLFYAWQWYAFVHKQMGFMVEWLFNENPDSAMEGEIQT